jgi:DNA polymerase I-like protein with 3'-5' exonuclease and polymerase domains
MKGFFYAAEKKVKKTKVPGEKRASGEKKERAIVVKDYPRYPEEEKKVTIILDPIEVCKVIDEFIAKDKPFAMDYETSGKKPHKKGHFIRCISLCNSLKRAYVFPLYDKEYPLIENEDVKAKLHELLTSSIGKIAHNIKFEAQWTKYILGYSLKAIFWDTMIAAHCLDNSSGVVGLKYQIKKRYGIGDYEAAVEPYIYTDKKESAHAKNKVHLCPLNTLLLYCGMDSLFCYRLYIDQLNEIDDVRQIGYDFFIEGIKELVRVEQCGIHVNLAYYEKKGKELLDKMQEISDKIYATEEAKAWKGKKAFKFTSGKDLGILFKQLGYKSTKQTAKGNDSFDKEALAKMKSPIVKLILAYRRYLQIHHFLSRFSLETVDGVMYPSFNLHTVATYRSSSSDPNFQNIPKRDEEAQKILRGGLTPSKGRKLLEVDYSGVEVSISACMHKDPEMIRYINDPLSDMHSDVAIDLFMLPKETTKKTCPKNLRQGAKNCFVFPQFYGDYYVNCAAGIWDKWLTPEDKKALKEKGIKSQRIFEKHVKKVEEIFWYTRFKGYTAWKKRVWAKFEKEGTLELPTGFISTTHMRKNEALNFPVQGPAFHCLLWSFIQVNKLIRKEKLNSRVIGQIHDSMVIDLDPAEEEYLLPKIQHIMCVEIKKHFKWIIVPLKIEAEISKIDGNWAEMEEVKIKEAA